MDKIGIRYFIPQNRAPGKLEYSETAEFPKFVFLDSFMVLRIEIDCVHTWCPEAYFISINESVEYTLEPMFYILYALYFKTIIYKMLPLFCIVYSQYNINFEVIL